MTFDDDISTTVPLSKVLDQLINDNESPDIIVNFLKLHEADFKDIRKESFLWTRIFQLDFLLQCNTFNIDWILAKLKSIPGKAAAYLAWQVCKSESSISDAIKYKFRKEFAWILKSFDTSHPYGSHFGTTMFQEYDIYLFRAAIDNNIANEICAWPIEKFNAFINNIEYSLFAGRFLQYDVFSVLDDAKKYLFLKSFYNNSFSIYNTLSFYVPTFVHQVLDSNECLEVKQMLYRSYYNTGDLAEPNKNDYPSMKTFSEIWMKMHIFGEYNYTKVIESLLAYKRFDVLYDWIKFNKKQFDEAFNISDLVIAIHEAREKKRTARR